MPYNVTFDADKETIFLEMGVRLRYVNNKLTITSTEYLSVKEQQFYYFTINVCTELQMLGTPS